MKNTARYLSLLLLVCVIAGLLPSVGVSASAAETTYAVIYNKSFDQSVAAQSISGIVSSSDTAQMSPMSLDVDTEDVYDPMLWQGEEIPVSVDNSPTFQLFSLPVSRTLYELREFYGYDMSKSGSDNQRYKQLLTLAYSSNHANIWVEVAVDDDGDPIMLDATRYQLADIEYTVGTTPKTLTGGFTYEQAQTMGDEFDNVIYPTITDGFGDFYDLDNDGKVSFLFYNVPGGGKVLGQNSYQKLTFGFFYNVDMDPYYDKYDTRNKSDCLHMNTLAIVPEVSSGKLDSFISTMAHEYQHLVEFSQRRYIHAQTLSMPGAMPAFINEGMSVSAEHMIYSTNSTRNEMIKKRLSSFNTEAAVANGTVVPYLFNSDNASYGFAYLYMQYLRKLVEGAGGDAATFNREIYADLKRGKSFTLSDGADRQQCADSMADIVARYIPGVTADSLLRDFHIATMLKKPDGPHGFGGEAFFNSISRKLCTEDLSSKTLASGGAVVVSVTSTNVNPTAKVGAAAFTASDSGGAGYIDITNGVAFAPSSFTIGGASQRDYTGVYTLFQNGATAAQPLTFNGGNPFAALRDVELNTGGSAIAFAAQSPTDTLTLSAYPSTTITSTNSDPAIYSDGTVAFACGDFELHGGGVSLSANSMTLNNANVRAGEVEVDTLAVNGGTLLCDSVTANHVSVNGRTAVFVPQSLSTHTHNYQNGLHPADDFTVDNLAYVVAGNVTLPQSLTIAAKNDVKPSLYIPAGATLTVPDGMTLDMNGGEIYAPGRLLGNVINYELVPLPPVVEHANVSEDGVPAELVYDGSVLVEPTATATLTAVGNVDVTPSIVWAVTRDGEPFQFGDTVLPGIYVYTLTITADGYSFSDTLDILDSDCVLSFDRSALIRTFEVSAARASVTIDGIIAVDREYDGNDEVVLDASGASIYGLVAGDESFVAVGAHAIGRIEDINASEHAKTVTLAQVTLAGEHADRYTIDTANSPAITVKIGKSSLSYATVTGVAEFVINDFAQVLELDFTNYLVFERDDFGGEPMLTLDEFAPSGENPPLIASGFVWIGSHVVEFNFSEDNVHGCESILPVTVSTPNFKDCTVNLVMRAYDPVGTIVNVQLAANDAVYTGAPYDSAVALATLHGKPYSGALIYTYSDAEGELASPPVEVGNYSLEVAVADSRYDSNSFKEFDITPAPLTLTAVASPTSVAVGSSVSRLTLSIKSTGLLGDDVAYTGAPIYVIKNTSDSVVTSLATAGTYSVHIDPASIIVNANYLPSFVPATFTAKVPDSNNDDGGGDFNAPPDEPEEPKKTELPPEDELLLGYTVAAGIVTVTADKNEAGGAVATINTTLLDKLDADSVTVQSDLGTVRLDADTLKGLTDGDVMVSVAPSVERGSAINITFSVDGNALDRIDGGVFVSLPLLGGDNAAGMVVKIIHEDGTETIVKKSTLTDGQMQFYLPGSATVVIENNALQFNDTSGSWAANDIAFATSRGLFNGTSSHEFSPNAPMTRAMLVTVLHRLEDTPDSDSATFPDVAQDSYFNNAVSWASEQGIVTGVSGDFRPNDNITREQLAVMLYRYAAAIGSDVSSSAPLSGFADAQSVSSYATQALEWAVSAGIIGGKDGGVLDPRAGATRAEVAAMLQRFVAFIVT